MKIVDGFMFYNELDFLFYRLSVLYDYVDYFVIVESQYTHSGKEKPLFYEENKDRFSQFQSKIIHSIHKNPVKESEIDCSKGEAWKNENSQRDQLKDEFDALSLAPEDIILISDLDEIPDIRLLQSIRSNEVVIDQIYGLRQDFYYYNLNTRFVDPWVSAKIMSYGVFKETTSTTTTCSNIRFNHVRSYPLIERGGWHLSYFGDKYFIQNKLTNFAHQEYNSEQYTNLETIQNRMLAQTDLYGRPYAVDKISIKDNAYLPPRCHELLTKYILY
jgi:beta-1,4-mannosyl-glycoprotein beta-1,4-N-acetylglucosaminyltransferase